MGHPVVQCYSAAPGFRRQQLPPEGAGGAGVSARGVRLHAERECVEPEEGEHVQHCGDRVGGEEGRRGEREVMVAGSRRWTAPGGEGAARGTGDMSTFSSLAGAAGLPGCEEVVDT